VQGYLHAKDRLWQMEFQTHFAAGRLSEIVGKKHPLTVQTEDLVWFMRQN
jgi:penicillin amidase